MARHGKTIGIIEKMFDQVMKGKEKAWTTREGTRVYEMYLDDQEQDLILIHYGTVTLVYSMNKKEIKYYYGQSASDRDSLNTLLDCLNHTAGVYFRFGANIGFMLEAPENDDKSSFDEVEFIIQYEGGSLDDQAIIEGFQELINSGVVWKLQGSYGRTARALIDAGLCQAV